MADEQTKTSVQEAAENTSVGGILVRRWLGAWIDLLLLAGIFFGSAMAIGAIAPVTDQNSAIAVTVTLVLCVLYFPVTEGLWGRTLGKLITGTKVVDKDGRVPGFGRALVRTLFWLIEVNPVLAGGVPAGNCVMVTKRKQRIGDLVAGTYVLSADNFKQNARGHAKPTDVGSRHPVTAQRTGRDQEMQPGPEIT